MSTMSSDPNDRVTVRRDVKRDPGMMRWLLPLLALAILAVLLWSMLGNRDTTVPINSGAGSSITTPVTGAGSGPGTTGATTSGAGTAVGTGAGSGTTSGMGSATPAGTGTGTSGGTTVRP
jgi:hypothetical protein